MVVVPADIAVKIPDDGSIVPVPGNDELHVPLPVLLKAAKDPEHIAPPPVIADGNPLIVTVCVAVHPVGKA